jgi:hypothetical protein
MFHSVLTEDQQKPGSRLPLTKGLAYQFAPRSKLAEGDHSLPLEQGAAILGLELQPDFVWQFHGEVIECDDVEGIVFHVRERRNVTTVFELTNLELTFKLRNVRGEKIHMLRFKVDYNLRTPTGIAHF